MSDLLEASKIGAQNEFYDAYLYDANIDNGPRVDTVYQQLLASNTDGVVEFGCGTGTLLLSLARNGTPTLGVDRSEQMLTTFRRKILDLPANAPKPSLAQADLLTPIARTSMSVAILANELCNHLLTREDLLTGLRNAADSVRPGGKLMLDLPRFDLQRLATISDGRGGTPQHRGIFPIEGGHLQIWEVASYDPWSGHLSAMFRYEILGSEDQLVRTYQRTLHMHPWRLDEIVLALRAVGFAEIEVRDISSEMGHARDLVQAWTYDG